MNICCILKLTEMYDTNLESGEKLEIFYININLIWSNLVHLDQNGPTRNNEFFDKPISGINFLEEKNLKKKFSKILL